MSICSKCGFELGAAAKFCGKCGSSVDQNSGAVNSLAASDSEPESYGKGADAVIAFFQGRYFVLLVSGFAALGIVYALLTGGLTTSSVPSPAESYMMRDGWSPAGSRRVRDSTPPKPRDSSAVRRRFEAAQQQRSNQYSSGSRN